MTFRRRAAWLSLAGVVLTAFLALAGQIGPDPDYNPWQLTVSDYAVSDRGGVTDTAMVVFGGSALALLAALRSRRWAAIPLLLFTFGMFVAAIAPTDLGTELSTVGYVHRYASMAAFVALPIAAVMIRDLPLSRSIRGAAIASGTFMSLMAFSATAGDRHLIGLAERLLLLCELALLGLMSTATVIRLNTDTLSQRRALLCGVRSRDQGCRS